VLAGELDPALLAERALAHEQRGEEGDQPERRGDQEDLRDPGAGAWGVA